MARAHGATTRRRLLAGAAAAVLAPRLQAEAARWPARPLRILVAYPPGGVSDEVARALAERLAARLGVPVWPEHRPGAGGALAVEALLRSPPDGLTLCFAAVTALALARRLQPDAAEPLPVAGVMRTPVLVAGTPALPVHGFAEMLAWAAAHPGGLRWATTGDGTTGHRVLERVRQASGTAIVHVPYKGGGQQVTDALAGHFEVLSTNVAALQLAAIRAGRLQALAVGAPQRLPVLPAVPTLAELGLPEANLDSLFGLFAPPGTPAAPRRRLTAEVQAVLRDGPLRTRLLAASNLPFDGDAEAFAREIGREHGR